MDNIKSRKLLKYFSYEKYTDKCINVCNVRLDGMIIKKQYHIIMLKSQF